VLGIGGAKPNSKYVVKLGTSSQIPGVRVAKAMVTISDGKQTVQREMMLPGIPIMPSSIAFISATGNIWVSAQNEFDNPVIGVAISIYLDGKEVASSQCSGAYCSAECSYP
jgi:hypothetical protein